MKRILMVLILIFITSCTLQENQAAQPSASPSFTETPFLTATQTQAPVPSGTPALNKGPSVDPALFSWAKQIVQLDREMGEIQDQYNKIEEDVKSQTISLDSLIARIGSLESQLQSLQAEFENISPPEIAKNIHQNMLTGISLYKDCFHNFILYLQTYDDTYGQRTSEFYNRSHALFVQANSDFKTLMDNNGISCYDLNFCK